MLCDNCFVINTLTKFLTLTLAHFLLSLSYKFNRKNYEWNDGILHANWSDSLSKLVSK